MTQQTIDWSTRGQRLRLLDRLVIPELEKLTPNSDRSIRASASACKHVLEKIESHARDTGGSWPSQSTLATETGLSKRQVATAIARLKYLGLLAVDKRYLPNGSVGNLYSIVWSELAVLQAPKKPDRDAVTAPTVMQSPQTVMQSPHGRDAVTADRDAVTAYKTPRNPNETPPTERRVVDSGNSLSAVAAFERAGVSRSLAAEIGTMVTDEEADQIVRTFADRRNGFDSPGAIVRRVQNGIWPVKHEVIEAPTREAIAILRMATRRTAEEAESRRRREREAEAAAASRRREVGPLLDSMTDDERDRFAASVFEPFNLSRFRKNPSSESLREILIEALDQVLMKEN